MTKVFISHRKLDAKLAEKLAKEIRATGRTVWFDEWQIDLGDSIVAQVNTGLEETAYLILCLSSHGLSEWMNQEWMSTLARQLSGNSIKIIPVKLSGGEVPAILSDRKYGDLTKNWDSGIKEILKAIKC